MRKIIVTAINEQSEVLDRQVIELDDANRDVNQLVLCTSRSGSFIIRGQVATLEIGSEGEPSCGTR
jgi:hypothetical protein